MTTVEANIGNHVNIEINPENPCQAVASLDFNEPAVLDYAQVCDLLAKVQAIRRQIEWARTDYAHVREMAGKKRHLAYKDELGSTLCGRPVTPRWDKDPLRGTPSDDLTCKRCIRVYELDMQPDEEETLERQAVRHLEGRQNHSMYQF